MYVYVFAFSDAFAQSKPSACCSTLLNDVVYDKWYSVAWWFLKSTGRVRQSYFRLVETSRKNIFTMKKHTCMRMQDAWLRICKTFLRKYSGFSIIWTPIIRIRTFGRWLMSPCFRYQRKKYVAVTGVLLHEKTKLLYERLSQMLQSFFHAVRGLDYDLQRPSLLSEAANAVVHCITAWPIKRRGK